MSKTTEATWLVLVFMVVFVTVMALPGLWLVVGLAAELLLAAAVIIAPMFKSTERA